MSDTVANDYDRLKKAFLTMYNYTEDGYRKRFREIKPETEESQTSSSSVKRIPSQVLRISCVPAREKTQGPGRVNYMGGLSST